MTLLRKHREKVVINDDGGRERHVGGGGRQRQRVSQRRRLERGRQWTTWRFNCPTYNLNKIRTILSAPFDGI